MRAATARLGGRRASSRAERAEPPAHEGEDESVGGTEEPNEGDGRCGRVGVSIPDAFATCSSHSS